MAMESDHALAVLPLTAWPEPDLPAGVAVSAGAAIIHGHLQVQVELAAPSAAMPLLWPAGRNGLRLPSRCDGLWQHTCFEAFFGVQGDDAYWELNLAPTGDWNVYRLSGYRHGLQPEASLIALPFDWRLSEDQGSARLLVSLRCPLPPALPQGAPLQVGLTAVLAHANGSLSYWALHHPGDQPDFHDRRGWTRRL